MDKQNLKTNTSSENMTTCPPSSQAVKLSSASPRSTAAFNGETGVLLSDMAFVLAFDSDPKGNAEIFSIQKFKTVLSALWCIYLQYSVHLGDAWCTIPCLLTRFLADNAHAFTIYTNAVPTEPRFACPSPPCLSTSCFLLLLFLSSGHLTLSLTFFLWTN